MLRLIGVLDSNKNLYPITDSNITKYTEFCQYLHQFMLSDNIIQDNKIGLTLIANIVIIDLVKKADVIFIIPNMVLQTYIYSISAIRVVFHNKARKASKLSSLTKFT